MGERDWATIGRKTATYRAQLAVGPVDAVRRIKAVREATGLGWYEACDVLHHVGWSVHAALRAVGVNP